MRLESRDCKWPSPTGVSVTHTSLVVACLLKPLDKLLPARAAHRLKNGNPSNDGAGGITHLLGFVDDVLACAFLEDLEFLCDHFNTLGKPLGCFINPMKTQILTSTSGHYPLNTLSNLEPTLMASISNTIAKYSLQTNKSNHLAPLIPAELTSDFHLLGSPVRSPTFAQEFFNDQLSDVQTKITLLSEAITDPQTKLQLFLQCLIQKLPHLLGSNILHHFDPNNPPPDWTDWDGQLTATRIHITTKFLSVITGTASLPHHALLINAGSVGILDTCSVAIPDFMLSFTSADRHATIGIYLNKHLCTVPIH